MVNVKGICRAFRKWLRKNGKAFPLAGSFALVISGKEIKGKEELPGKAGRCKVEVIVGMVPGSAVVPKKTRAKKAVVVASTERQLFKRVVREADPTRVGSKRRVDYRLARNPKMGDGVQYWAKIDGKWREVPALYANPAFVLEVA